MTDAFDRRQEICSNRFDDKGTQQLTDLLRSEFLSGPPSAHQYGRNTKTIDGGKVSLEAFFQSDGKINDNTDIVATINCDDPGKYVRMSFGSKGDLHQIDVAKNGNLISEDHFLTIHRK
jgi:hypothetical protein